MINILSPEVVEMKTRNSLLVSVCAPALAASMTVVGVAPATAAGDSSGAVSQSPISRAGSQLWGEDLTPAILVLNVRRGKIIMIRGGIMVACTSNDGTISDVVFMARSSAPVTLRSNRFSTRFTYEDSPGRVGDVRLSGTLGSRGRGTVVMNVDATGFDTDTGAVAERCSGRQVFHVTRR